MNATPPNYRNILWIALAALLLLPACGTDEPGDATNNASNNNPSNNNPSGNDTDSGDTDVPSTDYFPLKVGYVWEYYEEDVNGDTDLLRYEITAKKTRHFDNGVGELEVYVLTNTFPASDTTGWREQFYYDDGTRVDRVGHKIYDDAEDLFKERQYVPGFLRFDRSRITAGDEWTETITRYETHDSTGYTTNKDVEYAYKIDSVHATVTLRDGTRLDNCIQITRTDDDDVTKVYKFALGIGKVYEETYDAVNEDKFEVLTHLPDWAK